MFVFFFDEASSTAKNNIAVESSESESTSNKVARAYSFATISSTKEETISNWSEAEPNIVKLKALSSTNTSNANILNEQFLARLDEEKEELVFLMRHEVIEDGFENEVVASMRPYYNENKYMTLMWLYRLYAQSQNDSSVFSSILDLLYCLDVKPNDMDLMVSLVSNGLNSPYSIVQETAIQGTEKWTTKECLDALKLAKFSTPWMASYAKKVIVELEKELPQ